MRKFRVAEMTFSINELRDILLSVLVLGLLFSFGDRFETWNDVIKNYLLTTLIIGVSFMLHEIGHKFVAQSFGAYASYKIWYPGLIISMIVGIASGGRFVFFAPGFVLISSTFLSRFGFRQVFLGEHEVGQISVAGPLTNVILIFLFKLFSPILPFYIWVPMVVVNSWLALFNPIPIPPLDGSKVFMWKREVWFFISALSLLSLLFVVTLPLVQFIAFSVAFLIVGAIFLARYGFL